MIQEQLDRLYKLKKQGRVRFVNCGLVNEDLYSNARTKVLWLLKDPNDPEPDDIKDWKPWNLPEQIRVNIKEKYWARRIMWKVVGALTYGMQQSDFPPFRTCYDSEAMNICNGLGMIGVTNLKKSGGGGSSKNIEILTVAREDIDLWTEEIRIMAPHIVICGGIYGYIKKPLGLFDKLLQAGGRYAIHNFDGHQCILLDMHHPAYRVSVALMFAFFKDCIEELRFKGLIP
ncbi:MAG: hypothetical protein IIA61_03605 [Candidatus Marinimicrobia bacterium]|nr:hypothetical protein [Candidatus Neomarinimicrobiota bacterium]